MTTARPAAIALEDATVAFRLADSRLYTAVEKADLTVADGEFVAIVGPTGCGKSTLLNVAAGLLKPAAGAVHIFGRPLTGTAAPAAAPSTAPVAPGVIDCSRTLISHAVVYPLPTGSRLRIEPSAKVTALAIDAARSRSIRIERKA